MKLTIRTIGIKNQDQGSPGDSVVKNLSAKTGDTGSITGSGRTPEKELATHSSILAWKIPDRGAWLATARGVAKSRARLHTCAGMEALTAKFILDLISGAFQLQSPFLYPNPRPFISQVQQKTRDSTQNLVLKPIYREEIIEAIKGKIQKQFEPSDPSLTEAKAS